MTGDNNNPKTVQNIQICPNFQLNSTVYEYAINAIKQKMIVYSDVRSLEGSVGSRDDVRLKKRALRDATICIGWLKLLSISFFFGLYFLVVINSKGPFSMVLQIMVLFTIIPMIIQGLTMFLGAIEENICALNVALLLCVVTAAYNNVLGIMGAVYFVRTGHYTLHFLLAVGFSLLAISLFPIICHDALIIYSFKKLLQEQRSAR